MKTGTPKMAEAMHRQRSSRLPHLYIRRRSLALDSPMPCPRKEARRSGCMNPIDASRLHWCKAAAWEVGLIRGYLTETEWRVLKDLLPS